MKKLSLKTLSWLLSLMMLAGVLAACGDSTTSTPSAQQPEDDSTVTETNGEGNPAAEKNGTLMYLSMVSSGKSFEYVVSYLEMLGSELGYDISVVYGDAFNDPAGNLQAVQNAMTNDVVGLIATQDGGIKEIMDEYPDLYVAGLNNDFRNVYEEDGPDAALLDNEKFLGNVTDSFYDGNLIGEAYAEFVIAEGYETIATMIFPWYAYPAQAQADTRFRELIEEHNQTADTPVEIVGDTKVLEFQPLDEAWFLEAGNSDLDGIVAFCSGVSFVYPILKQAIANGSCSADTKLITGGFEHDEQLIADIGNDGVIQYLLLGAIEKVAYSVVMLDNAIVGGLPADYVTTHIDTAPIIIDSREVIENVWNNSLIGTGDLSLSQVKFEDLKPFFTRYNADATQADLVEFFQSEQLTVEVLG